MYTQFLDTFPKNNHSCVSAYKLLLLGMKCTYLVNIEYRTTVYSSLYWVIIRACILYSHIDLRCWTL